ncbi:MAG: 6,7-dimethyl-8-ribityllumazine synthase [bacterium]|nr:6,7-dimethyl-8-ribityllumazine synthase [bacterium]
MQKGKAVEGEIVAPAGARIAIVATRWNPDLTDRLLEGAILALEKGGVSERAVEVFRAPGSFEIPIICQALAKKNKFNAIVAVGALLDGETDHYTWVAQALVQGLVRVSQDFDIPITFGLITGGDLDAALERAGGKAGNKGEEAALAAIEAISLIARIRE